MNKEVKEAWLRIPIGLFGAILIEILSIAAIIMFFLQFFIVLFTGKKNRVIVGVMNLFINYVYQNLRYTSFLTNERPFPFREFGKPIEKPDYKFQN